MADVAREVRKIVRLVDMASTPPAAYDRAVLTTLLETWGGLQSSKGGSWRSDRELSAWDGVTVDLDGRVTELRLNNCGLHGENLLFNGDLSPPCFSMFSECAVCRVCFSYNIGTKAE